MEEFLKPMGMGINRMAREIGVPPGRISEIVNGKRGVSADTALRLGRFLGVSPELWLGLQIEYDLRCAQRSKGTEIKQRIRPYDTAPSPPSHPAPSAR